MVSSLAPATAVADDYASYTPEQQRLNERAVRAIINEDYEIAISVLDESLVLGKLNITYLNLGRAYQKHGNCQKARAAFRAALEAPKVEAPSPEVVEAKVVQYLAEVDAECPPERETTASNEQTPPDNEPDETDESDESDEGDERVERPGEDSSVTGDDSDEQAPAQASEKSPRERPDEAGDAGSDVWAWTSLGAGVVMVGAGAGMHASAEATRDEVRAVEDDASGLARGMTRAEALDKQASADTLSGVGLATGVVGTGLIATGLYLFLTDNPPDVAVVPHAAGWSLVWTRTY